MLPSGVCFLPYPDKRGLMQWLIKAYLLTWTREREEYGGHMWDVLGGMPVLVEACRNWYRLEWVVCSPRGLAPGHGSVSNVRLHRLLGGYGQ